LLLTNQRGEIRKINAGNGVCVCIYTGCRGGNVPDFGIMFFKLKYTDLTKIFLVSEFERLRR